jgi:hypothetical protein
MAARAATRDHCRPALDIAARIAAAVDAKTFRDRGEAVNARTALTGRLVGEISDDTRTFGGRARRSR